MATGTPISNTVAEMWVFGRYLRPDLLEDLGITAFDDFRAQFCETVAAMELDPPGPGSKRSSASPSTRTSPNWPAGGASSPM